MDLKHLLSQTTIKKPASSDEVTPNEEGTEGLEEYKGTESNNGSCELESDIEEDTNTVDTRFLQAWNKLEKGMKMNRILLFVERERIKYTLSGTTEKELKNILFRGCEEGLFNKSTDVKYDEETGIIESFKQLEFNESSKKYKLKMNGSKNRSVSKSRSNIDRLMKKK